MARSVLEIGSVVQNVLIKNKMAKEHHKLMKTEHAWAPYTGHSCHRVFMSQNGKLTSAIHVHLY